MAKSDYIGYEQAAAISLNYALDNVEAEILGLLNVGAPITQESLRKILSVVKRQRVSHAHIESHLVQ
jgi:hypothetical protein